MTRKIYKLLMFEFSSVFMDKIRHKQFRRIVYTLRNKVSGKKVNSPRKMFFSSIRNLSEKTLILFSKDCHWVF